MVLLNQPEGLKEFSPGQRPGSFKNIKNMHPEGVRQNIREKAAPFQGGSFVWASVDLGRCPRLLCDSPSG